MIYSRPKIKNIPGRSVIQHALDVKIIYIVNVDEISPLIAGTIDDRLFILEQLNDESAEEGWY
jgi:hypothetical protein